MDFLGPQTLGGAGTVKGHVAAAQHNHPLAHPGLLTGGGVVQEIAVDQHPGQVVALHGQPDPLVSAQGQQNGVVFFGQPHKVGDPAVGLHMDPRVGQVAGLFGHHLPGQTVGRNAVGHLTAQGGERLFQGHVVALLGQVVGCGHAGGAAAHHADLLAGGGQVFAVLLPQLVAAVLGGVPLDIADGNGVVHIPAAALFLTGMGADMAQALGEGQFFVDHGQGLGIFAFLHIPDIPGHLGVDRAGGLAGNQGVLLLDGRILDDIPDGAGGADFGAGAAEPAAGVLQQHFVEGAHAGFQLFLVVLEDPHAPQVIAGPDAPAAQDTPVHVVDVEGVFVVLGKAFHPGMHPGGRHPHVLDQGLQFAPAIFGAGGAVLGVGCQQKLHGQLAQRRNSGAVGGDLHPLFYRQLTGGLDALLPFHFDDAQPAGTDVRQVGVMAQMGNVDAILQCGF